MLHSRRSETPPPGVILAPSAVAHDSRHGVCSHRVSPSGINLGLFRVVAVLTSLINLSLLISLYRGPCRT